MTKPLPGEIYQDQMGAIRIVTSVESDPPWSGAEFLVRYTKRSAAGVVTQESQLSNSWYETNLKWLPTEFTRLP